MPATFAASSRGNLGLLLAMRDEVTQLASVQSLLDGALGAPAACLRPLRT